MWSSLSVLFQVCSIFRFSSLSLFVLKMLVIALVSLMLFKLLITCACQQKILSKETLKFYFLSSRCLEYLLGVKHYEQLPLHVISPRVLVFFFLPAETGKEGLGANWSRFVLFMLQARRLWNECSTDPCVRWQIWLQASDVVILCAPYKTGWL